MRLISIHIFLTVVIFILFGCKKNDKFILHVTVDNNNNYIYDNNAGFQNYYLDLTRNGTVDMLINLTTETITSQDPQGKWIDLFISTYSIVDNNTGLEVAATNDCIDFLGYGSKINEDAFTWESTATIATNNKISNCNTLQNTDSPYFALRIKDGDSYRYGWIRIDYNLANTEYDIREWAIYMVDDKEISTGQTKD